MSAVVFGNRELNSHNFPFEKAFILTEEQISTLRVKHWGESDLQEFQDSRFTTEKINDTPQWIVTRHRFKTREVSISLLNSKRTMPFASYSLSFDELVEKKIVPLFALEQVPDKILGHGCMGQVYEIKNRSHGRVVFKIERKFTEVKMGDTFYPLRLKPQTPNYRTYIPAQSHMEMNESLFASLNSALALRSLPQSIHYPQCHGIVYVKEFNLWGVVSEYIEGKHFPSAFESVEKAKRVLKSVAKSLNEVDKLGYAYTDMKRSNILVREDETAVLVDDVARGVSRHDSNFSLLSRQKFGSLLYSALLQTPCLNEDKIPDKKWQSENQKTIAAQIDERLCSLIFDCWSSKDLSEFSWDKIIRILS